MPLHLCCQNSESHFALRITVIKGANFVAGLHGSTAIANLLQGLAECTAPRCDSYDRACFGGFPHRRPVPSVVVLRPPKEIDSGDANRALNVRDVICAPTKMLRCRRRRRA